jgi:hypothetical protein
MTRFLFAELFALYQLVEMSVDEWFFLGASGTGGKMGFAGASSRT